MWVTGCRTFVPITIISEEMLSLQGEGEGGIMSGHKLKKKKKNTLNHPYAIFLVFVSHKIAMCDKQIKSIFRYSLKIFPHAAALKYHSHYLSFVLQKAIIQLQKTYNS